MPLINQLSFIKDERTLSWMDGKWYYGRGDVLAPAPGVGHASTMKQAEVAGRAFIYRFELEGDDE